MKRWRVWICILCLILPITAFAIPNPLSMNIAKLIAQNISDLPDAARERPDTIVFGVSDLFGDFNPFFANTSGDIYATELLFDEWVFLDEYGRWNEGMAKVTISRDGMTYWFELKDARYTDGARVSAEDAVNALYLVTMPGYVGNRDISALRIVGLADYLNGLADTISGIKIEGEYTFSITLEAPNASAPVLLALPVLRVAHFGSTIRPVGLTEPERTAFYIQRIAEIRESDASLAGYGQYLLESSVPGVAAQFTANPTYWRAKPSTPFVELRVVPVGQELDAMVAGDIDLVYCYPSAEVADAVYNQIQFISMYTWPDGDVIGYLGMREGSPLFEDAKVRQALAYGLRRRSILQETLVQYGHVPGMLLFDSFSPGSDIFGEQYPYDAEKAAALMDEAGWVAAEDGIRVKDGQPFVFTFYVAQENPVADVIIQEMQYCCEWLGLKLTTERLPYEELAARVSENTCDMYLQAQRLPTSPAVAASLFRGYRSPELDRFQNWADQEGDPSKQSIIYEGFYQQIYLELPIIPIYRRSAFLLVSGRVRNFYISTGHDFVAEAYRMILISALAMD